jgi:hypothetical protein
MKSQIKIHNLEQQTPDWFKLKLDFPFSGSNATAIHTGGKGLETLCWETVAQKLSNKPKESFSNEHTERGNELESQAVDIYELYTGNKVESVGFITNSKYEMAGVSPDGLVGDDGLLEVKCFADVKYLKLLANLKQNGSLQREDIENGYWYQMQQQLLITERKWVDYILYNPNFKESIIITRVYPDETTQDNLKKGIIKGQQIIKEIENKLK